MALRLVLVGGGKMGTAMLEGWLKHDLSVADVVVIEPIAEAAALITEKSGVRAVRDASEIPDDANPDTIVLAVKPQMMDDAIGHYVRFVSGDCVFVSVAAGKTITYFEQHLGPSAVIVRTMPNTPAAIGRGITVCCANCHVSDSQRDWTDTLLKSVGVVEWVNDEKYMDAVTALSGGGPAYVFLLVETMARAGIDAGLPADLAMRLARTTVAGAGELLHQSDEEAATLRQNVTSPAGTTYEALKVLMADDAWQPLMTKAVKQATLRSEELANHRKV